MDALVEIEREQDQQPVTAVISHLVKRGREQDYERWLRDISVVAQQFEGHQGVSFIRPQSGICPEYVIILKFDRYTNLKQWLQSDVRRSWLAKAKPLIQRDETIEVLTGLETWFTLPGKPMQLPPARYKMVIVTGLAVFTIANLLNYTLTPFLTGLPTLLRSLLFSFLSVSLLTYIVMPRLTKLLYRWLYPRQAST